MKSALNRAFAGALVFAARHAPIGYWRMARLATKLDPRLTCYTLPLKYASNCSIQADLRESVFTGILRSGTIPHQQGLDRLLTRLVAQGDTVVDVGANVGYTAILCSKLVGATGTVIAMEPSPTAFRLLTRSIDFNGLTNTIPINAAAGSSTGIIEFYERKSLDLSSFTPTPDAAPVNVPVTTLDDLCRSTVGRVHLVKIDVEGHECDVFHGMKALLSLPEPPIVVFEALSTAALERCLDALDTLSSHTYEIKRISFTGRLLHRHDDTGSNDYLAVPEWAGIEARRPLCGT